MKRIIYITAIIITVMAIFTLPAQALVANDASCAADEITGVPEDQTSGSASDIGEENNALADTDGAQDTIPAGTQTNAFAAVFDFVMENRAAVLSALSFISALYVALSYKKALLPTIKDMILKIKKSTDEVGEKNERCEKELQAAYSTFVEKAEQYESRVRELQAALADISDSKCAQARIENALLCELDMLYEVFMAASLPQYEKDRVGEKFAAIRRIAGVGDTGDA